MIVRCSTWNNQWVTMMTNETSMQNILQSQLHQPNTVFIPNVNLFNSESDLVSVTMSGLGYTTEYEIKTSRSDFLREFKSKQRKHNAFKRIYETPRSKAQYNAPNYFWFVFERDVKFDLLEIPEYAGVIQIAAVGSYLHYLRMAERIHGGRITQKKTEYIMRGLAVRYWNTRNERRL